MKKRIHFLCVFLIFSCSAPSEFINDDGFLEKHEVEGGEWHGRGSKYYPSGKIAAEGQWKYGKMHGEFKEYFENGNLSMETTYVEGIEKGLRKTYFETGELSATREISNGLINGKYIKYFKSGKIENIAEIKDDQLNGESIVFTENGDTIKMQSAINGKIIEFTEFYENGNKQLISVLVDSISSKQYEYYQSGEPKKYSFIKNNRIIYQRLYSKNKVTKGLMLPLSFEVTNTEVCIELLHSIIPKDSLGIEVFLMEELSPDFSPDNKESSFKSEEMIVCFPKSKKVIIGYLCEIYSPAWNNEGCFPFAFNIETGERLDWTTFASN